MHWIGHIHKRDLCGTELTEAASVEAVTTVTDGNMVLFIVLGVEGLDTDHVASGTAHGSFQSFHGYPFWRPRLSHLPV